MSPEQFKEWRASLCLSQAGAARALGLSRSSIIDYEVGIKRGTDRAAPVPRVVELACRALSFGAELYDRRILDEPRKVDAR